MKKSSLLYPILLCLFFTSSHALPPMEICDNEIDDDGDGLIDFQDDDCICEFIEIRSLIPNPSFEQMSCCPDQFYRLDCAAPWVQAYGVTPDYIHSCGWLGPEGLSVPQPFPDGDGIIGFANGQVRGNLPIEYDWKEYAMTCLLEPMVAGTSYRIEFSLGFASLLSSPPLELTIYGTSDCNNIPFGITQSQPGCPTNFPGWERLEGRLISPANADEPSWVDDYFEFTPNSEIRAIAIGADCAPFPGERTEYYFLDNLIMEETFLFQYQISATGDPCQENFTLSVSSPATLNYQWYKDSIALVGETNPSLQVIHGDGNYQVRMIEADGCRMSPPYNFMRPADQEVSIEATICEGDSYTDGDFNASAEGSYQYILPAIAGCDSIINLNLKFCQLYVPNIFSPNRDGVNDTFKAYGAETLNNYSMLIYDRWGGLVYEGLEWNGEVNGKEAPAGVYIYVVRVNTATGERVAQQGDVTLVR